MSGWSWLVGRFMVHLNGEMARDYVKGEFSMQGSAGMAIIEDADEMFIKGGQHPSFHSLSSSQFIILLHIHRDISLYFRRIHTIPTPVRAQNSYIQNHTVPYATNTRNTVTIPHGASRRISIEINPTIPPSSFLLLLFSFVLQASRRQIEKTDIHPHFCFCWVLPLLRLAWNLYP